LRKIKGGFTSLTYRPQPIKTSGIILSDDLLALGERLAENAHDLWASQRLSDGWKPGEHRDDLKREHPNLVPYNELSEEEKDYDRLVTVETLKAIIALGYTIEKR
jgi:hypothetical protein